MFCITPGVLLGQDFFDFTMTMSDFDDGIGDLDVFWDDVFDWLIMVIVPTMRTTFHLVPLQRNHNRLLSFLPDVKLPLPNYHLL